MKQERVFELYKPLRNSLRKVCLEESLYVIWAYCNHLQFNSPIPKDISTPSTFMNKSIIEKGIYSWELESLTKEVIINSPSNYHCDKSLRDKNYMAHVVNKLKSLEDSISGDSMRNPWIELFRIAHRQFPWQTPFYIGQFMTYYKLFNYEPINKIILAKMGVCVYELYRSGFALFGAYLQKPFHPISNSAINEHGMKIITELFACEIPDLREKLISEQEMNDRFVYAFASLRAYPIIKMHYRDQRCLFCPLPTLLLWRFTGGLYYELCKESDFGSHFGKSFERLTGEIINIACSGSSIEYLAESEYFDAHIQGASATAATSAGVL